MPRSAETVRLMIEAGAKVAVGDVLDECGRETLHALEGTGGTALYLHLDVTRQQDWYAMVAAVLGRFGTLDILVNTSRGTATSLQMRSGYGTG